MSSGEGKYCSYEYNPSPAISFERIVFQIPCLESHRQYLSNGGSHESSRSGLSAGDVKRCPKSRNQHYKSLLATCCSLLTEIIGSLPRKSTISYLNQFFALNPNPNSDSRILRPPRL